MTLSTIFRGHNTMTEQTTLKWEFTGALYKAAIGNGLLNLIVLPADLQHPEDDLWVVQINGAKPIKPKIEPCALEDAKRVAASYAAAFCRSMVTEVTQ